MALTEQAAARKDARGGDWSAFQHRHYAAIAAFLASYPDGGFATSRHDLAHEFAAQLATGNPRFDRARFLSACKVEG